jgi:tetratricopeptide (TPR) repeat protein
VAELKGHKVEVTSASFSPDGTRIVTASMDGIARVWDSVLYRERFAEIEAVRKAEPAMGELVTRRLTAGESPAVLAESLAKDRAFTEPQRAAALAALHRRCTDEAKARREASSLNGQAWPVLVEPNSPAEAVARALDQAARAAVLAPDDGYIVNTLGVARYRVGDYEHALATLRRSDELNSRSDAPHNQGSNQETPPSSQPSYTAARDTGLPTDAAFITMSLHQLCRADEARAALERLRRLMEQDRWTNDKESQAFLREAEALIEGTPTSAPASAPDTDAPSSSSAESTEPPDE